MVDDFGHNSSWDVSAGDGYEITVSMVVCPGCGRPVLQLSIWHTPTVVEQLMQRGDPSSRKKVVSNRLIWPSSPAVRVDDRVPPPIREDFLEAAAVLVISPKASAALSRRCLEAVLDDSGEAEGQNLFKKIESLEGKVPSYIFRDLDALRQLGNRGAHLKKKAGQILTVDSKEAQWNLAVLSELFDHYYVKPDEYEKMRRRIQEAPTTRNAAELLGFAEGDEGGNHQEPPEDQASRQKQIAAGDGHPPEEDLPF